MDHIAASVPEEAFAFQVCRGQRSGRTGRGISEGGRGFRNILQSQSRSTPTTRSRDPLLPAEAKAPRQGEAGPQPEAGRPRKGSPVKEESGPGPTTSSEASRAPPVAEAGNRNGQKSRSAVEGGALARHHPGNTDQRKNRWRGDDPGYGAVRSRSPVDAPTRATCI